MAVTPPSTSAFGADDLPDPAHDRAADRGAAHEGDRVEGYDPASHLGPGRSCRLVLAREMKVTLAAPTSGSTTTMAPNVGITLASSTAAPNTTAAMPSLRRVGRARLAAISPPMTAPRPSG